MCLIVRVYWFKICIHDLDMYPNADVNITHEVILANQKLYRTVSPVSYLH